MRAASRVIATLALVACDHTGDGGVVHPAPSTSAPSTAAVDALRVPARSGELAAHPDLAARVGSHPHRYLRYVNQPFSQAVCDLLGPKLKAMPRVHLHGDAHLEQYAVTSNDYGLVDFDAASVGPAVIDLVRFGVSIRILARSRGWADEERLVSAFLDGYRGRLQEPEAKRVEPAWVKRTREAFPRDRREFLSWADSIMKPVDPKMQALMDGSYDAYQKLVAPTHPELAPTFFSAKRMGRLELGIGSATDPKFLVRAEGPTAEADDDVILEFKEAHDLSGVTCVVADQSGAFRVLEGHYRFMSKPPRFLAQVPRVPGSPVDAPTYWAHEWPASYQELDVASTTTTPDELVEVVFDAGQQLARGHHAGLGKSLDQQLRMAQLDALAEFDSDIRGSIAAMTDRTMAAWEGFHAELTRAKEER